MKNETLISLSERTGFSISTVSRVLSGQALRYRISKKTVDLISEEARRCNYTPSLLAKGLRTKKTNTIGLLIPSIENNYFAIMASVIIHEAKQHSYKVVVVDTMEDELNEAEGLSSLLARKVDGILLVPCGKDPSNLEKINSGITPIVLIDRYFPDTSLPYVCTNNYQGAVDATRCLINNGHKKIACIQGIPHSMPNKERLRGFIDTLNQYSPGDDPIIIGENFSIQNGYMETKLVLNKPDCPTALFTLGNTILLGAIKAIRESELKIPDDISIVSFDDNMFFNYLDPAITCVSQPIDEIGILAVKILIKNINDETLSDTKIQLPPKLIIRNSIRNFHQDIFKPKPEK